MPYLDLIKQSFDIVRRRRYLWFYGLFAGGASFNFQASFPTDSDNDPSSSDSVNGIDPGVVVAIAVVVLVLLLLFIALSTISQGALADSVAAEHRGERRGFGAAWRSGTRSFWRVLGLGLLAGLIGFVVVLAVLLPVAASIALIVASTDGAAPIIVAAVAAGIPALIVLIGLFLVLGVTIQLAMRHLVLAQARVFESLRAGWHLLRDNLIPSGAIFLLQQVASFVGSIVIVFAVVLLCVPTIILLVAGVEAVGIVAAILTGLIVIPLALTAYGALGAFNHSLWTLTYLQMHRSGV